MPKVSYMLWERSFRPVLEVSDRMPTRYTHIPYLIPILYTIPQPIPYHTVYASCAPRTPSFSNSLLLKALRIPWLNYGVMRMHPHLRHGSHSWPYPLYLHQPQNYASHPSIYALPRLLPHLPKFLMEGLLLLLRSLVETGIRCGVARVKANHLMGFGFVVHHFHVAREVQL